jgi:hypothetical protein
MINTSYNLIEDVLTTAGMHFQGLLMEYFWNPNAPFFWLISAIISCFILYAIYQFIVTQSFRPLITYALTVMFIMAMASWNGQTSQNQYVGIANQTELNTARQQGLTSSTSNNVNGFFAAVNGLMSAVVEYATYAVNSVMAGADKAKADMSAMISMKVLDVITSSIKPTDQIHKDLNEFLSQHEPDGCGYVTTIVKTTTGNKIMYDGDLTTTLNYIVYGTSKEYEAVGGDIIEYIGANQEGHERYKAAYDKYMGGKNKKVSDEILTKCRDLPEKLHKDFGDHFNKVADKAMHNVSPGDKFVEWIKSAFRDNTATRNAWIRHNISSAIEPNIKIEGQGDLSENTATLLTMLGGLIGNIKEPIQARVFVKTFVYFQGYMEAFLFALFPIVLFAPLIPGGWKFLLNYFGMILWVKSWSFFAVLIAAIHNWLTLLTMQEADPTGAGLLDLAAFLPIFMGVMMWSIPAISYAVIFGGWGDFRKMNFSTRVYSYGAAAATAAVAAAVRFAPRRSVAPSKS